VAFGTVKRYPVLDTAHHHQPDLDVMLTVLKKIWKKWKHFAHGLNAGISWVLMAIAYVLAMGPVALWFRIRKEDLIDRGLGPADATSYWLPVTDEEQDVRRAQRPW